MEFFAAGFGFSSGLFDNLLCSCFFDKALLRTSDQLFGAAVIAEDVDATAAAPEPVVVDTLPGSDASEKVAVRAWMRSLAAQPSRAVHVNIPVEFHLKQWRMLYRHLVDVEHVVPLGLYRCEAAAGPLSPAQLPYVFTAPPPETIISQLDRAIVVVRHDNALLRRVGRSMTMGRGTVDAPSVDAPPSGVGAPSASEARGSEESKTVGRVCTPSRHGTVAI